LILAEPVAESELPAGAVGTIVEPRTPDMCEVEFSDTNGRTVQMLALSTGQMKHYQPGQAITLHAL